MIGTVVVTAAVALVAVALVPSAGDETDPVVAGAGEEREGRLPRPRKLLPTTTTTTTASTATADTATLPALPPTEAVPATLPDGGCGQTCGGEIGLFRNRPTTAELVSVTDDAGRHYERGGAATVPAGVAVTFRVRFHDPDGGFRTGDFWNDPGLDEEHHRVDSHCDVMGDPPDPAAPPPPRPPRTRHVTVTATYDEPGTFVASFGWNYHHNCAPYGDDAEIEVAVTVEDPPPPTTSSTAATTTTATSTTTSTTTTTIPSE